MSGLRLILIFCNCLVLQKDRPTSETDQKFCFECVTVTELLGSSMQQV